MNKPGARPSSFKRGGGFLNDVDITIVDYQFTDEFNGQPFVPGKDPKTKKARFHSLYALLTVRIDGADEDSTTTLFAGGADDFVISDDGHTLTPLEDGRQLGANTAWAKFITSLEEQEISCESASYPDGVYNYEPVLGIRAHVVQQPLSAAELASRKRRNRPITRMGKDGREYELRDLVADAVLAMPAGKAQTVTAKTAAKTVAQWPHPLTPATSTPATSPKGKSNGKIAEEDLANLADETLLAILADAGGSLPKNKLPIRVAQKLSVKHPQKDGVRQLISSDKYLVEAAERGIIAYDPADGDQTISAV